MINKFQTISEPQSMCDVCSMAVTNPICPNCLTEEFKAWLTLYPDLKKQVMPKLRRYLMWLEERLYEGTLCIKCRQTSAAVCPYCFTEYVFMELKKLEVSKIVLTEFFEFFNFDFDHTGYSKEAEKLGVI
ncbi:hypothetical protein GOV12_07485 [Candidatus Pacearchaeota archaeon]|nr:hypothetical protein [Candidatus Pacearchaeota archaeon]